MTNVDPNPLHWSSDIKTISAILVMVVTVIGSSWKAADYIGEKIYTFAEIQTKTLEQLTQVKSDIVESNRAREQSLAQLSKALLPRIDTLEKAVNAAESEASAAKARADDMKDDLRALKGLASQNLAVSVSHSEAINATRAVIAPRGEARPH